MAIAASLRPNDADAAAYCRNGQVRARMLEYCGATAGGPPTCAFIVGWDRTDAPCATWEDARRRTPADITALWDRGADISRSLWDDLSLVFLLDLDYQNTDWPGEAFLQPAEMLFRLEPVYRALSHQFGRWRWHPMALLTGRGYHFTGRIPLSHPVVDRLAALWPATPGWLDGVNARRPEGVTLPLAERTARAHMGLGLLIEYLAHVVLRASLPASALPVVFNGTTVGPGRAGRAAASIDFSHVGDPLDVRHMRVAFSPYQSHRLRPDVFGADAARLPAVVALPRGRHPVSAFVLGGRGLAVGLREARLGSAQLPDIADGVRRLLASYRRSRLARVHREFLVERPTGRPMARSLDGLPACMTTMLEHPNDLLLKPAHLQHLVRGLLARGWRAVDIAALVLTRYDADYGWGDRWLRLAAATRADFDVRVFAGLVATGADALIDFNCVSAQEKGLCPRGECPFDLRRDRGRLQAQLP